MSMHIHELDLPPKFIEILETKGYTQLYPPQEQAVKKGVLKDTNMVLAVPTASGKTLIAFFAVIKALEKTHKCVYIVPLKALAEEKYQELKELGINAAITTGDFDSTNRYLHQYDVIVTTSEKCDSLLRHDTQFFNDVHLVIADEVHLMDDSKRGPTLEMILAKMKHKHILALSATISNASELAEWLQAELVESEWRPVPLKKGVYFDDTILYENDNNTPIRGHGDPCVTLAKDGLQYGQVLFFVNTRRSTKAVATRIADALPLYNEELSFSDSVYQSDLKHCSKHKVSFHHAGLKRRDRLTIEDAFKENKLRILVATPTLAAGINLPARRVVVRDVKRYYTQFGYHFIPVLEIQQMMGRAGRPKYDDTGEAILVAKKKEQVNILLRKFIQGEPEPISSKLASQPALRTHILALLASEYIENEQDLKDFFSQTFYVHQNGEEYVYDTMETARQYLERHSLIDGYTATDFGKRVSQLYIDPASAVVLHKALHTDMPPFGILHAVSSCPDMPSMYLRKGEFAAFDLVVEDKKDHMLLPIPDNWEEPEKYEMFLSQIKMACLLDTWLQENDEKEICTQFRIGPGDLYRMRETADWLVYAFAEIAPIFDISSGPLRKLRRRLRYGIKEELLPLVKIKNIGRVRARKLYDNGYKTVRDIKKAPLSNLKEILGEKIAENIKEQLTGNVY